MNLAHVETVTLRPGVGFEWGYVDKEIERSPVQSVPCDAIAIYRMTRNRITFGDCAAEFPLSGTLALPSIQQLIVRNPAGLNTNGRGNFSFGLDIEGNVGVYNTMLCHGEWYVHFFPLTLDYGWSRLDRFLIPA